MLNLAHHKIDFSLDATWTFSATGYGKGAGDGVGVGGFLKSTTKRATLSKGVRLSSTKDFYDFLKKHQLETVEASGRSNPTAHIFYLEANEIEKIKNRIIDSRMEKLKYTGNV
jgi:hypothetical protein